MGPLKIDMRSLIDVVTMEDVLAEEELLRNPHTRPFLDRFWAKVDKSNTDKCWPFVGQLIPSGYGLFIFHLKSKIRPGWRAHRMSYLIAHGEIRQDLVICHRCDNPPCCNPAHLFQGTDKENYWDARKKNRIPMGTQRYNTLLNEQQVREIRAKWIPNKYTQPMLAKEYNVTRSCIQDIVEYKCWRYVK